MSLDRLSEALTGIERYLSDPANLTSSEAELCKRLALLQEEVRSMLQQFAKPQDSELVTR